MYFNPFHGIIENEHTPHSFTLRSSLWAKLNRTYEVFSGNFTDRRKRHFGLFDYLVLMIPAILSVAATLFLWGPIGLMLTNALPEIISVPLVLLTILPALAVSALSLTVNYVSFLPRHLLALTLTVIAAPIVSLVHLVASYIADPLFSDVREVTVGRQPLEDYMNENAISYEDLAADYRAETERTFVSQTRQLKEDNTKQKTLKDAAKLAWGKFKNILGKKPAEETTAPSSIASGNVAITVSSNVTIQNKLFLDRDDADHYVSLLEAIYLFPYIYRPAGDFESQEFPDFIYNEVAPYADQSSVTTKARASSESLDAMFQLNIGGLSSRYGMFRSQDDRYGEEVVAQQPRVIGVYNRPDYL